MYQVSFNDLQYFQRYAPDRLIIAQIRKKNNCAVTYNRIRVLAFCTSSDDRLSMYQVSFNSLLYFQGYALDRLFIVKVKKAGNSVHTGDMVLVLAFCHFPYNSLSVYQVSLKLPSIHIKRYAPDKCVTDGRMFGWTDNLRFYVLFNSILVI